MEGVFSEVAWKNAGTFVVYICPPPKSTLQPLRGKGTPREGAGQLPALLLD
jgi:hypothetical protein